MGNIVLRKNRVTANTLIGKVGELTINTTDKTLYIHDGSTAGGFSLFRYNTDSAIIAGQVPFSNGTQGVLATNSKLFWDNSNNRLGLNTTTPDALLTVSGVASFGDGTESAPSITNVGDLNTGIYFPSADTVSITTGGVEKFRVEDDGDVVITGSPLAGLRNLDIYNTDTGSGSGSIIRLITSDSSGTGFGVVDLVRYKNGTFVIANSDTLDSPIAFNTGGSERFRIDKNGNVGIGTASPATKLHVGAVSGAGGIDGNVTLSAGTNMIYGTATSGASLTWNANTNGGFSNTIMARLQPRQDASANYNLDVFVGTWNNNNSAGTAVATFQSTGNVGIGTTSPKQLLHVAGQGLFTTSAASYDPGDGAGSAVRIGYNTGGDYGYLVCSNTGVASKRLLVNGSTIEFLVSGAERIRIDSSGNVGIATTTPSEKLEVNGTIKATTFTNGTYTAILGGNNLTDANAIPFVLSTGILTDAPSKLSWSDPDLLINGYKAFHSNNVAAGTGISITGTSTFTIANTGIVNIVAGTDISVGISNGVATIGYTGVSGGSSGGVTSLAGLTGTLTLSSPDFNINAVGTDIALSLKTTITPTFAGLTINGTASATTFSGSGSSLTSLPAGQLTGTIPSGVLGNSSLFVGTTSVALNRASANLALTGITSINTISIPSAVGTPSFVTTGDSGTVTSTMIADGTIVNGDINASAAIVYSKLSLSNSIVNADISTTAAIVYSKLSLSNSIVNADISTTAAIAISKLAASTISGVSLGNNLNTLTIGTGLSGTSYNGSAAVTIANTGVLSINGNAGSITGIANSSDVHYIGTTSVALNRASANLALTGISSVTFPGATSGTVQLIPTAAVGTGTVLTIPATTGTIVTTGDSGTVTSTMIADGTIVNGDINASAAIAITKLAASTISGVSLGNNLNTLTIGTYLTGTSYNGSAAVTIAVDATTTATASKIVARDASGTVFATTFSGSGASLTNIPNGALTNSSITVNGSSISLGGSVTVTANTSNSITFNNGGTGAISGTTFNGSAAQTISYNTIGAPSTTGTNASGSWGISVTGSSASCTGNAATATILQTSRTFSLTGDVTATGVSFNGSGNIQLSTTIGNATVTSAKLASSLSLSGNLTVDTTTFFVDSTNKRIGVGTTSPVVVLHTVSSNAGTPTTTGTTMTGVSTRFVSGSVGFDLGTYGNGAGFIQSRATAGHNTNYDLILNPNGGNVGIGTISPARTLHVHSTTPDNHIYISSSAPSIILSDNVSPASSIMNGILALATANTQYNQNAGTLLLANYGNSRGNIVINSNYSGTGTTNLVLQPSSGNVGIGTSSISYKLHVSGDVYATGDVYAGSDIRMKENIVSLSNALQKVKNLQGYSYNKIGVDHRSIGLIAQDVEKIIPEVVSRNKEGMKGIDYGQMIALLVEAIKELNTKLEVINGTTI